MVSATLMPECCTLRCRIRFDYSECVVSPSNTQVLEHAIAELAKRYQMDWRLYYDQKIKKVAILVSKMDHCLYDLLIRLKAGELNCQVPIIISNHPDLAPIAEQFGVAFRCSHHPSLVVLLTLLVLFLAATHRRCIIQASHCTCLFYMLYMSVKSCKGERTLLRLCLLGAVHVSRTN